MADDDALAPIADDILGTERTIWFECPECGAVNELNGDKRAVMTCENCGEACERSDWLIVAGASLGG